MAYALVAILIFAVLAGSLFNLPEPWRIGVALLGFGSFVLTLIAFLYLAIWHTDALMFSEHTLLRYRELQMFGTAGRALTAGALDELKPIEAAVPKDQPGSKESS